MVIGPAPRRPRASSRRRCSPGRRRAAGSAHIRWRTPSSSTTSTSGGPAATAASRSPVPPLRVVEQRDDGTRVDAGRAEELVAVLLRAAQRPLVRQDAGSGPEGLEPEPGEEPALGPLGVGPGHAVGLLVDVDGRMGVLAQGPVGAPGRERAGSPSIAVVRLVAELLDRQVEPDDVGRVAGEQPRTRRPDRSRRTAARRPRRGPRRWTARSAGRGKVGGRARIPRDDGATASGSGTTPSYDSVPSGRRRASARRHIASDATFTGGQASLLRPSPA